MTVTFAVEKLADIMAEKNQWPTTLNLLLSHWAEVALFKHVMKFNPDFPRYQQLEREGKLHLVIAREDRKIVGYSVHIIITRHPHYRHVMTAEENLIYLAPHLRRKGVHQRMRAFVLKTLTDRQVRIVTAGTMFGHDHDTALRKMGFEPYQIVYACDLTKWKPPIEA
jgi:L-amino acid N-acyltransferase YncA